MPRRSILSTTEQISLLALPECQNDLIRYYTFTETDLALIRQRRGDANRMGFAVQLCLLRYPGSMLLSDMRVAEAVIQWVASQIQVDVNAWIKYAERDETRREHFQELRSYLGLSPFGLADFRFLIKSLTELAMQTDKGLVIAVQATEMLRQRQVILPAVNVIDRACAEAITLATRRIYRTLIEPLTTEHKRRLDELLKVKPESGITWLVWLRQSPVKPNSRHMLEQIERLKRNEYSWLAQDASRCPNCICQTALEAAGNRQR
jgi:TnpA family transposase